MLVTYVSAGSESRRFEPVLDPQATPHAMSDDHSANDTSSIDSARRLREEAVEKLVPQLRQALQDLRFGQIVITVQDGLPVQIERTEKTRLR